MAGFSPMKYCHCKANEQNGSLSSEKHFGVTFMQWEEEKFILNFRSVASNWVHGFSVLCWTLLFPRTLWLRYVPAWNWKHTGLSACLQQLSTKALTCLEHKNRHHDKLLLRRRPGKSPACLATRRCVLGVPPPSRWIRQRSGWRMYRFIKVQDPECPSHIHHPHPPQAERHLQRQVLVERRACKSY